MEFIWGQFPGRYGTPLAPADTTSIHFSPMAESVAHTACDVVEARVLWGDDPRASLRDDGADTGARAPLFLTAFGRAAVGAITSGSGLG